MGTHPESRRSASEENSESEFDFLLLVSHTPDNFHWAVREGYDLVLSGHTHGGQVRLPLIGPVFAPSLHGTRYASGTFARGSTMLHVSRGVSGIHPLRWFCRPEISLLTLRTTDDAAR
jgi:predicted MPP superfamily phosphohydrolase